MLRQTTPGTILTLLVLWLILPAVARGQGQPPSDPPGRPGKNPKVEELFRDKTPLQIAIEKAREKRANEQKINPPCQAALDSGNEDDIARFCKVPRLEMKKFSDADCGDCGELLNPAGKVVGHRVRTETKLTYQNPGQRGKSSWDKVLLKRLDLGRVGDGVSNRGMGRGDGPRARTAVLFPEHAVNEDKDCVDQVTGEHRGGYLNGQIPAAGTPESCFEADGTLKRTMVPGPGGCEHIA
ncbi:MAG: hypothetical protein L0191_19230, partial [Acidobacteria bacterium]|nr:hypothetical protein [Acidobacteriota bacterium]